MLKLLKSIHRDTRGVSALEYAILAAVILGVIVVGVNALGVDISELFGRAGTALDSATTPTK